VTSTNFVEKMAPLTWSPNPATTYSTPQTVSVSVTPPPSNLGGGYVLCTAKGSLSIPPQPNTCTGLGAYLTANTGTAWNCTSLGTAYPGSVQPVSLGQLTTTTTVTAVACKESMLWSTSQVTYSFNPFSDPITIDGAEDFVDADEALTTSGGDTAYLSWDATNIYYGYKGFAFGTGQTVDMYFGITGTTTDDGPARAGVVHQSLYHLVWVNTSATASMRKWSGSAWAADATVPVTVGYTGGTSDYVEFSFTRAAIGNPTVLWMAGGLQNSAGNAYLSAWPDPLVSWSDSYFVELLGAAVPNASAKN
jgi:hypothetical protein